MTATMHVDGQPVAPSSLSLDLAALEPALAELPSATVHGTIAWDDPAAAARLWFRLAAWPAMRRRLLGSSAIVAPAMLRPGKRSP